MKRRKIVLLGYMGACPLSGVIWQHLHYIVGLQDLGHDVYYVEDSARMPYDPVARTPGENCAYAVSILQTLAEKYGFRERWAYRPRYRSGPAEPVGLCASRLRTLYSEADAILNLCGSHELHEDLARSERLVYVESDPGFLQIQIDKGDALAREVLAAHRCLFTFGENIGTERFPVPVHGVRWLPTRQPVVTRFWEGTPPPPPSAPFTTVTNWSATASIEWRGRQHLWNKALEFLKFVDVPGLARAAFEIATEFPDRETEALFRRQGWRLRGLEALNLDLDAYRSYIRQSRGEFTAAKSIVVALDTGWFSDRSATYLAAGRPVVTQETGFTRLYGGDRGLFGFRAIEEAIDAVERINADYARHCAAAHEIAKERFEAKKVLKSLLERAGV